MTSPKTRIDVLIPTRGRTDLLRRCLRSLEEALRIGHDVADIHLLICANGGDAEAVAVIQEFQPRFKNLSRWTFVENLSAAAARNRLLPFATAEWLFFIDDDAAVDPDFFLKFDGARSRWPKADVIGGPNLTPSNSSVFQRASGAALASKFGASLVSSRYAARGPAAVCGEESLILCNLFVRRTAMQSLCFTEELTCNEENWLLQDLLARDSQLVYEPDLGVWHERRKTPFRFMLQVHNYGVGRGQNLRRRTNTFRFFHLCPALCVGFTLITLILGHRFPPLLSFWRTLFFTYLYFWLASTIRLHWRERLNMKTSAVAGLLFPVIHGAYGLGVWRGLLDARPVLPMPILGDNSFRFQLQGVTAVIYGGPGWRSTMDRLRADFAAFQDGGGDAKILVEFKSDSVPDPAPWVVRQGRFARVHGWGRRRVCSYPCGTTAMGWTEKGIRRFQIWGSDSDLTHEVAYTILHSAIGEELDLRGFHRVHGLGLEVNDRRLLLLGPSGAGKSSLACLFTRQTEARLYSDESPLIGSGATLYPFPIRFALAPQVADALDLKSDTLFQRHLFQPKKLFPFPTHRRATAAPVDVLILGARHDGPPRIQRRGRIFALPKLLLFLVVGQGLAQMAEWMLRIDALPRLTAIAFRRAWAATQLLFQTQEIYEFQMGANAQENFECLNGFLKLGRDDAKEYDPPAPARPWLREPEQPAE